jgi:hypothetical protein
MIVKGMVTSDLLAAERTTSTLAEPEFLLTVCFTLENATVGTTGALVGLLLHKHRNTHAAARHGAKDFNPTDISLFELNRYYKALPKRAGGPKGRPLFPCISPARQRLFH